VRAKAGRPKRKPQAFRRADLVGKFPYILHLAAPQAVRLLDSEERERIVAATRRD
jgi:hypothetical protein